LARRRVFPILQFFANLLRIDTDLCSKPHTLGLRNDRRKVARHVAIPRGSNRASTRGIASAGPARPDWPMYGRPSRRESYQPAGQQQRQTVSLDPDTASPIRWEQSGGSTCVKSLCREYSCLVLLGAGPRRTRG